MERDRKENQLIIIHIMDHSDYYDDIMVEKNSFLSQCNEKRRTKNQIYSI